MEAPTTEKKRRPGGRGKPRLNRKRYKEAVSFLKQVIADEGQKLDRRMNSVRLLLEIYDRSDRTAERRERRAESDSQGATTAPDQSLPQSTETAEEAAEKFLQSIRAKKEANA
jgi:hypothetical protein